MTARAWQIRIRGDQVSAPTSRTGRRCRALPDNLLLQGRLRDPRSGDHHRRADPLRRDLLLPFQPSGTGRVYSVQKGSRLCGPGKGHPESSESCGGRHLSAGSRGRPESSYGCGCRSDYPNVGKGNVGFGSTIFAVKPGDGSAREQAASCQKVLGGWANIANEYATKRYRSNLINWGMLPFVIDAGEAAVPQSGLPVYSGCPHSHCGQEGGDSGLCSERRCAGTFHPAHGRAHR